MADSDVEGGLKSVAHALDVLDCFMTDEELGVSEIARRLGVAKSTAHRILTTLVSRGLVEHSAATGKYHLGVHLFELGHLALSRLELRKQSVVLLEELRELTGWMVHLAVASGADTLFLERLPTLRGMQVMGEYRRRWPLHATSSGKVLCAFDPVAALARTQAGFPVFTPRTISTAAQFEAELAKIRKQGYATANEELMLRLASVAAPVLDAEGFAIASISVTGPSADLAERGQHQIRLVTAAAQRLSRNLQVRTSRQT